MNNSPSGSDTLFTAFASTKIVRVHIRDINQARPQVNLAVFNMQGTQINSESDFTHRTSCISLYTVQRMLIVMQ